MSLIKLSIITPCFNPGAALRQCVESVSKQIRPGIEHVIQDACSTDGSVEYLADAQDEYSHIVAVSERDKGQSNAMNKALARCRGDFIGILNADDCYEDGAFDTVFPLLQEKDQQPLFLHGNLRVVNHLTGKTSIQAFPRLHRFDPYFQAFPWNPASYFYSKRLHAVAGMFDEEDHYNMDLKFILEAFRVAELRYVDKILGTYFIHPGAKTHDDLVAGKAMDRQLALIGRERAKLPWSERVKLSLRGARREIGYRKHLLLHRGQAES